MVQKSHNFLVLKSHQDNTMATCTHNQEEAESTNVDLVLEHIPKIVFKDENIELVHPIIEEKIILMIWSLGPYKASRP
jgi:hypothetical protein